jgi:hypothetical protein
MISEEMWKASPTRARDLFLKPTTISARKKAVAMIITATMRSVLLSRLSRGHVEGSNRDIARVEWSDYTADNGTLQKG